MTTLQSLMQVAFEATYGQSELGLAMGGIAFPTRPDSMTDPQIAAIFRYGKRMLNDAFNSEAAKLRESGDPTPNPVEFFKDWFENLGSQAVRGGGTRQTVETAGRIAYYNSKGSLVKFKGQTCTGKNLVQYDITLTKKAILGDIRAILAEMDETEQRAFVKDELPGIILDNMEEVLNIAQADTRPGKMGDFIESERRKRAGTIEPETFQIKATIRRKTG